MQSQTKSKSLLYLSVYDPHVPLTGSGIRGTEFVNNLAKRFNLDLVYLDGSGQPSIPELSHKYASKLQDIRAKTCIAFSQLNYFVFSRNFYKKAIKLLKQNRYNFIICDYGLSAIYGILLSNKFNLPFLYFSHNLEYLG